MGNTTSTPSARAEKGGSGPQSPTGQSGPPRASTSKAAGGLPDGSKQQQQQHPGAGGGGAGQTAGKAPTGLYHSKPSLVFPDFAPTSNSNLLRPPRVTSQIPSAPIPIPMGQAAAQRPIQTAQQQQQQPPQTQRQQPHAATVKATTNNIIRPIDADSPSMQDLVTPRQPSTQQRYTLDAGLQSNDSGPLHNSSAPRGPQPAHQQQQQQQQPQAGTSAAASTTGPRGKIVSTGEFAQAYVQSTVPLGLTTAEVTLDSRVGAADHPEIPTLVTWSPMGQPATSSSSHGKEPAHLPEVWVQDRYNGRTRLTYNPEKDIWSETIRLPPGNMSLRFLVDGQWEMSTDLPLASEDDGALVNYVTVLPPSAYTEGSSEPGPSRDYHPPMYTASRWLTANGGSEDALSGSPPWTSDIPQHLTNAQVEEETYATHAALPVEQRRNTPFPPVPVHPTPPYLPRHLDKVILSSKKRSSGPQTKRKKKDGKRYRNVTDQDTGIAPPIAGVIEVEQPQGDDDAVLPVPSHVVLHHLGTSAIRDGVIAVCDTVRYKKKYITTVFYKPMYVAPDPALLEQQQQQQHELVPPPVPELQQPPPGNHQ